MSMRGSGNEGVGGEREIRIHQVRREHNNKSTNGIKEGAIEDYKDPKIAPQNQVTELSNKCIKKKLIHDIDDTH